MYLKSLILTLFAAVAVQFATASVIYGVAEDYAGSTLCLYTETDGITAKRVILSCDSVDADGNFRLQFDCDSALLCKMDLGHYESRIFVEPGKTYSVNLPKATPKSKSEQLNPYFQPTILLLSINNADDNDLNVLISNFEDKLDSLWNEMIFGNADENAISEFYGNTEEFYSDCNNKFFNDYRKFSYAMALGYYGNTGRDVAIANFMLPSAPAYSNPAYWSAFLSLMERFPYPDYLKPNRELYELTLLYNVQGGFLSSMYLDSMQLDRTKNIAAEIRHGLHKTAVGNKVEIEYMVTLQGDTVYWQDIEQPYIYVCFASSDLVESLSDLAFADKLTAKWGRNFAFVFVFMAEDKNITANTCSLFNQIEYICSAMDNPALADAFGVSTPPQYFVITNSGLFEISPAPMPAYFEP